MSNRVTELRLKRIRRDQNDLDALDARLALARRDHADAQRAFELADTTLRVCRTELEDIQKRRDQAAHEIDSLRRTYQRDFMQHFPLDLLRNIFEFLANTPNDECGSFTHNIDRISAPFILSGVCRKWRNVVLAQSKLWRFISASQDVANRPSTFDRIKTQLERSQNASLDISLAFAREWANCQNERSILQQVSMHARRWRSFELSMPDNAHDHHALQVLKGPLPLLEHLLVIDDNGESENFDYSRDEDDFLPYSPKLQTLSIWGPNAIVPRTLAKFPALRSLRLWYQPAFPRAWHLVAIAAQTLESLVLAYNDDSLRNMSPSSDIVLPHLRSLGLCGTTVLLPHLSALRLPRLQELAVEMEEAPGHWAPFFEAVSPTVTLLTLTGSVRPEHLPVFATLHRVETLTFGRFAPEHGEEYRVGNSFFDARELWVQQRLWPRLTSVKFTSRGAIDLGASGSVLPFVRWRTTEIDTSLEDPVQPLRSCSFDVELPDWMAAEVERLINAAKCR